MKTITIDDNPAILELMKVILQRIDPTGKHFFAGSSEDGLQLIQENNIRIIFLDIEMPGLSGDAAARYLMGKKDVKPDIIFITGHPEYALLGHRLHCTAFVTKPFDEADIEEALQYLRNSDDGHDKPLKICCDHKLTISANGVPVRFERSKTAELLAYLVYRNGAVVTNSELLTAFWGGNLEKADYLRKIVKDLRDRLAENDADDLLIKKRGSIGIDMSGIEVVGDISMIQDEFGWIL